MNGHKWWASGAMDPRCQICIFMGKTDPSAATHKQQSMVLVPMAAPGVRIVRPLTVFGYDDAPHGHAELMFEVMRSLPLASDCIMHGLHETQPPTFILLAQRSYVATCSLKSERAVAASGLRAFRAREWRKETHGEQSIVLLQWPHQLLMHGRPLPSSPETSSHVCRKICTCRRTACCWARDAWDRSHGVAAMAPSAADAWRASAE